MAAPGKVDGAVFPPHGLYIRVDPERLACLVEHGRGGCMEDAELVPFFSAMFQLLLYLNDLGLIERGITVRMPSPMKSLAELRQQNRDPVNLPIVPGAVGDQTRKPETSSLFLEIMVRSSESPHDLPSD